MKSDKIRISVIIPCYNHGEYLEETLQSLRDSSYDAYEIIIVNDGSTDPLTLNTLNDVSSRDYLSGNGSVIPLILVQQPHSGVAEARNHGIRLSRGEYIFPLDADDKIGPDYLSQAAEILDTYPDVGVVYPHARLFGDREGILGFPPFDPKRLLAHNCAVVSSLYRKVIWEACGGYDPEMKIGYEDWDFWISAMEQGWKFHLLRGPQFYYRIRDGSRNSACMIPENRRELIRYICHKHRSMYSENLGYVISEKDAELLQAHLCIRELESVIGEKDAELNRIRNSRGWKLILKAYRIRDFLFPRNRKI